MYILLLFFLLYCITRGLEGTRRKHAHTWSRNACCMLKYYGIFLAAGCVGQVSEALRRLNSFDDGGMCCFVQYLLTTSDFPPFACVISFE